MEGASESREKRWGEERAVDVAVDVKNFMYPTSYSCKVKEMNDSLAKYHDVDTIRNAKRLHFYCLVSGLGTSADDDSI